MIPLELIVTKVIIIPTIIKEVHPTILNTTIIKMVPIKYNNTITMVIIPDPINNIHIMAMAITLECKGSPITLSTPLNEGLQKKWEDPMDHQIKNSYWLVPGI